VMLLCEQSSLEPVTEADSQIETDDPHREANDSQTAANETSSTYQVGFFTVVCCVSVFLASSVSFLRTRL